MYCRNCGIAVAQQAVFCPNCGAPPLSGKNCCWNCGQPTNPYAEICLRCGVGLSAGQTPTGQTSGSYIQDVSPKSRTITTVLAWFLGFLGVHRFYIGKIGTGIAMIFTFGGLGIWWLIDFILAVAGSLKDGEGRPVKNW